MSSAYTPGLRVRRHGVWLSVKLRPLPNTITLCKQYSVRGTNPAVTVALAPGQGGLAEGKAARSVGPPTAQGTSAHCWWQSVEEKDTDPEIL